jgi:predicted ferric reductase
VNHALWYLVRGTGVTLLLLFTASVVVGILSSLRVGSATTPRFVVQGVHRGVSLLALVFLAIHVVATYLDGYAPIRVVDAAIPFVSAYKALGMGLGALALDLLVAVAITSYLRTRLGYRGWRGVHLASYAAWPLALLHGVETGTDAHSGWLLGLTVACALAGGSAFLCRMAIAQRGDASAPRLERLPEPLR